MEFPKRYTRNVLLRSSLAFVFSAVVSLSVLKHFVWIAFTMLSIADCLLPKSSCVYSSTVSARWVVGWRESNLSITHLVHVSREALDADVRVGLKIW